MAQFHDENQAEQTIERWRASGLGDAGHDGGPCRAYWGQDERGQIVALVSDFFSDYHGARLAQRPSH